MPFHRLAAVFALGLGAFAALAAGSAQAEILRLQCRVHETKGAAHRDMLRRIEVDTAGLRAKVWDNVGHGWLLKGEHAIVSAGPQRIVLEAGEPKQSAIDRMSGVYTFHNAIDGVSMRGECQKAGAGPGPRF